MASVGDVLTIVLAVYQACDTACAAKKLLGVASRKMETLLQVLPKVKSSSGDEGVVVARVLKELESEIQETSRLVQKAQRMSRVVYMVKAGGIRDDLEANLRHIHLSLMTLEATRNEVLLGELRNFHREWQKRQRELTEEAQREKKERERLLEGNVSQKAERITGVAGRSPEEVDRALRELKSERDDLRKQRQREKDSAAQTKARLEEEAMEQIIAALEFADRRQQESEGGSATGPTDAAGLPDWCMCPITAEVMMDPVIVSAPCMHTCSRGGFDVWMENRNLTCPVCGVALRSKHVAPNAPLRAAILQQVQQQDKQAQHVPSSGPSKSARHDVGSQGGQGERDESSVASAQTLIKKLRDSAAQLDKRLKHVKEKITLTANEEMQKQTLNDEEGAQADRARLMRYKEAYHKSCESRLNVEEQIVQLESAAENASMFKAMSSGTNTLKEIRAVADAEKYDLDTTHGLSAYSRELRRALEQVDVQETITKLREVLKEAEQRADDTKEEMDLAKTENKFCVAEKDSGGSMLALKRKELYEAKYSNIQRARITMEKQIFNLENFVQNGRVSNAIVSGEESVEKVKNGVHNIDTEGTIRLLKQAIAAEEKWVEDICRMLQLADKDAKARNLARDEIGASFSLKMKELCGNQRDKAESIIAKMEYLLLQLQSFRVSDAVASGAKVIEQVENYIDLDNVTSRKVVARLEKVLERVNASKQVLRLKESSEFCDDLWTHLEKKMNLMTEEAKGRMGNNDKKGAILALKRKKIHEECLDKVTDGNNSLDTQILQLECLEQSRQEYNRYKVAMAAGIVPRDNLDEIAERIREVFVFLPDQDALLAELEELEAGERADAADELVGELDLLGDEMVKAFPEALAHKSIPQQKPRSRRWWRKSSKR